MSKFKKGQSVLVQGTFIKEYESNHYIEFKGSQVGTSVVFVQKDIVAEAPPEPFDPKVGDVVFHVGRDKMYNASPIHGLELLYIHQEVEDKRKWAVVAYYGDIPKSVYFEDLRETYAECAA